MRKNKKQQEEPRNNQIIENDVFKRSTLKDLIANNIVERKSYDEIPPRVEYTLTERGQSVVPILQSICRWAGIFYKENTDTALPHCRKCDYK